MNQKENDGFTVETALGHFGAFFDERKWKFHRDESAPLLMMSLNEVDKYKLDCRAGVQQCDNGDYILFFISSLPVAAPKKRLSACAELFNRINYGLIMGNFEMEPESGLIHIRTSTMLPAASISETVVQHLVLANLATIREHFETIMETLFARSTPERVTKKKSSQKKPAPGSRLELN